MKFLKLDFGHPIKGHASLRMLSDTIKKCIPFSVDSRQSNQVEIPLNECQAGRWKIVLDWEYENRTFTYQNEFDIV